MAASRVGKLNDWLAGDQENEAGHQGGYQITANIVQPDIIPNIAAVYMFLKDDIDQLPVGIQ